MKTDAKILATLAFALWLADAGPALAQYIPIPPTHCVANCDEGGGGGGGRGIFRNLFDALMGGHEPEHDAAAAAALELNHEGVEAYRQGDYSKAVRLFSQSLTYRHHDQVLDNLKAAQNMERQQEAAAEAQRRQIAAQWAAEEQMRSGLAQVLSNIAPVATPTSTRLATAGPDLAGAQPIAPTPAALGRIEPPFVDARGIVSTLPKSVDQALAHSAVGDRVRMGFLAIQDHDWAVAKAWFQDAQFHDPDDPGLKRLVALSDYMLARQPLPRGGLPIPSPPVDAALQKQIDDFEKSQGRHPSDGPGRPATKADAKPEAKGETMGNRAPSPTAWDKMVAWLKPKPRVLRPGSVAAVRD